MLEILNNRYNVDSSTPLPAGSDKGNSVLGRTIRLQTINGGSSDFIGVMEFECLSSTDVNLCRSTGTIPTLHLQNEHQV